MALDDASDVSVAAQTDINSANSGIKTPDASVHRSLDEIADAVERAKPRGSEKGFFAKTKAMRCTALARAYPLYMLLRDDPDGTKRLLDTHKFPHRKRRPNKGNVALISVMIALHPTNDDDHACCCEEAYALRSLAERGVPASDFEHEYMAATIMNCKRVVRSEKRKAKPAEEPKAETTSAKSDFTDVNGTSAMPYFAVIFVGPHGTERLFQDYACEVTSEIPITRVASEAFQAAYQRFLRQSLRLSSPSELFTVPEGGAAADTT